MLPWGTVFFAINVSAALGFVVMCVAGIGDGFYGGTSPFAFIGSVCFIWPAMAFAVAEWCLYMRNARRLERPLGIVCGGLGALAVFALVSNVAEAVVEGNSPPISFWFEFGSICLVIAAYNFWCCWLRVRRQTFPETRGFSVGPPRR